VLTILCFFLHFGVHFGVRLVSVVSGACQLTRALLQMAMVHGGVEEGGEEKSGGVETLAALTLSKSANKDPSTDVRAAACIAIMRIARDTKEAYFQRTNIQKLLLPAVVTCAMDRKNVRMRTAADRALYYMLAMGEEVETLEARVRKTNKSIIKGTKGSADMMTFMNIHYKKVARLVPEATWDL
jgi:hypothetical protein